MLMCSCHIDELLARVGGMLVSKLAYVFILDDIAGGIRLLLLARRLL